MIDMEMALTLEDLAIARKRLQVAIKKLQEIGMSDSDIRMELTLSKEEFNQIMEEK